MAEYQYVTVSLMWQDLLKDFSCPTKTEYKCECGKESEDACSQITVQRLPEVLVLQLHRFHVDEAVAPEQRAATGTKVSLLAVPTLRGGWTVGSAALA